MPTKPRSRRAASIRSSCLRFSGCAGLDVGRHNGLPVGPAYSQKLPYPFTGSVKKVIFDLQPKPHQTAKRLQQVLHHAAVAGGISASQQARPASRVRAVAKETRTGQTNPGRKFGQRRVRAGQAAQEPESSPLARRHGRKCACTVVAHPVWVVWGGRLYASVFA